MPKFKFTAFQNMFTSSGGVEEAAWTYASVYKMLATALSDSVFSILGLEASQKVKERRSYLKGSTS